MDAVSLGVASRADRPAGAITLPESINLMADLALTHAATGSTHGVLYSQTKSINMP